MGWEQMWAAVGNDCRWDVIVSSSLKRCAKFARALAQRHSLPLKIDERLCEMHSGAWEGHNAAELMQTDPDNLARFWRDPEHHAPTGGESGATMRLRVMAAWHDAIAQDRTTLIVTHGGPIRAIL